MLVVLVLVMLVLVVSVVLVLVVFVLVVLVLSKSSSGWHSLQGDHLLHCHSEFFSLEAQRSAVTEAERKTTRMKTTLQGWWKECILDKTD